jgi:plastocyanin
MRTAIQGFTRSRAARTGVAAMLAAATVGVWASTGGAADKTLRTMGTEDVHINSKIFSDLRFSPGQTNVRSGATLTLVHTDKTDEPHTLTIVDADERPTDTAGVFDCGSPGTLCDEVFNTVGPQIADPSQAQFVDVSGGTGLDGRLDTVWLPPGSSIEVAVTAPPGTTLAYFCAIHAWMQGTIIVG